MTTRRDFLQHLGGAWASTAILSHGLRALPLDLSASPRREARLRVLILGGTSFLGPHLVHILTQRGHGVSIFTRGRREPGLFEEDFARVEHLVGDRAQPGGYAALQGKTWDAVIETSGQRHPWTRESVALLENTVGQYLYVSSTGVFYPYLTTNIPEDGPVRLVDEPPQDPPSYGVMKALSENEVRAGFGDRATIVRPGYIVGPGDPSDRWTYWPVRVARGGEVLVPGRRTDPVQYIDVRDLLTWTVGLLESHTGGTFNAVGPTHRQTMAEFVSGLAPLATTPVRWTWIEDYDWLKSYPLRKLRDGSTSGLTYAIPWVMVEGDALGHMQIDGRKAAAAGLTCRPLLETARDTLAWRASDAAPQELREHPRYVMTAEQEQAMLTAWHTR
jgi:2'-hydroxyisoflavone reductase